MSLYTALTQVLAPFAAKIKGIQTGYDGTEYDSPGEAVREQINDLHVLIGHVPGQAIDASAVAYNNSNVAAELTTVNGRLAQQQKDLNALRIEVNLNLIADEFVTHTGAIESYSGWSRTDYIDVSTASIIYINNTIRETDYCHFYDADKNPTGNYFNVSVGDNSIPTNGASYVILSNQTGSINKSKMRVWLPLSDSTLTKSGKPADAKTTGDSIKALAVASEKTKDKIDISSMNCEIFDWSFFGSDSYPKGWRNGRYNTSTGLSDNSNYYMRTLATVDIIKTVDGAKYFTISVPEGYAVSVTEYNANDDSFVRAYGDADVRNADAKTELLIRVIEGNVYKFTVGRFENNDADTHITDSELINSFVLRIYWSTDYANIPEYYFPYIRDRADKVNEVSRTVSKNSFAFAFITDYHSLRNAKQSKKLLNYICKNAGIETVVFGGDAFQNWKSLNESMRYVSKVYNILANAGERRFLTVYGNHEWNDITGQMNNLSGVKQITTNGVYFAQSMDANGNYYIDYEVTKTRCYFISSTVEAAIPNSSLEWLGRQLEKIPAGWYAMVICHCGLLSDNEGTVFQKHTYTCINKLLGAYDRHEPVTLTTSAGAVIGTFNYESATGSTICYLCGHVHEDLQILKENDESGVLTFSTTGDLYKNAQGTHYTFVNENGETVTRNVGTVYEQAFDVIHVDIDNRKIICTRIGAGLDREFSF